jgi:hypothetical protein
MNLVPILRILAIFTVDGRYHTPSKPVAKHPEHKENERDRLDPIFCHEVAPSSLAVGRASTSRSEESPV